MTEPRVLYSADDIQARVEDVAAAIAEDYRDRQLVLVAMLIGAGSKLSHIITIGTGCWRASCYPRLERGAVSRATRSRR